MSSRSSSDRVVPELAACPSSPDASVYEVVLGWDPTAVPADWRSARHRYFTLNWIRGAFTWIAFGRFLAAGYAYVT
ncbi:MULTISPECIES: hypothetical protein [unclassified Geodermatophilus]